MNSFNNPIIKEVRGRGLFRSIEMKKGLHVDGNDLAYALMKRGILSKASHSITCRLAPPLMITEKQMNFGIMRI